MPVPKQRKTKSKRNQRRSHHALKAKFPGNCSNCGQPALPHHLCENCGYYKGRQVVDVLAKLEKKEKKNKEKELEEQTQEAKAPDLKDLSKS